MSLGAKGSDQGGEVAHALTRQIQPVDDALGQGEQGLQLLAALDFRKQLLVAENPRLALDGGDLVQALVVVEETIQRVGILSGDQPFECPCQALALEGQCPAHRVLKDGVSGQNDSVPAQQIHRLAQNVDRPAGDARGLAGMRLEQEPLVQGAEAIAEQFEDRLDVALAGVVRDRDIGDRLVVEVAPTQIIDSVADGRQLEAKETLAGSEVARVQQKVDLGSDRASLLDINEQTTGLFAVTWNVPTRGDRALAITPRLPESLELLGSPTTQDLPGARIEHATYKNSKDALTGQTIAIEGLSALQTDVLLLVQLQDGTQHYLGAGHIGLREYA